MGGAVVPGEVIRGQQRIWDHMKVLLSGWGSRLWLLIESTLLHTISVFVAVMHSHRWLAWYTLCSSTPPVSVSALDLDRPDVRLDSASQLLYAE
eukprot:1161275-Pelagomonas_calceolata.AAC.11